MIEIIIYFGHQRILIKLAKMDEADLKCPLCRCFFTAPVLMTKCGHNYCEECLKAKLESLNADSESDSNTDSDTDSNQSDDESWSCLECRNLNHEDLKDLARNYFLENTVDKFIAKCSAHHLDRKLRKYFNTETSRCNWQSITILI